MATRSGNTAGGALVARFDDDELYGQIGTERLAECEVCRDYGRLLCDYCRAYMDGVERALTAAKAACDG